MVTKDAAITIARELLRRETGQDLKCYEARLIDQRHHAELLGVAFDESLFVRDRCWAVSFESRLADGTPFDGPTVVDVNSETGEAKFFYSL